MSNLKIFNAILLAGIASLILIGCGGGSTSTSPPPAIHNEWTWVGGADVVNQTGNYGTLGIAAPGNVPGARAGATVGTDADGNFWLFGGSGASATTWGELNDLWKYSGGQWTWISGSSSADASGGVYGTQGVAAPGNFPGPRWLGVSWTDNSGNFWIFGGTGLDSTGPSTGEHLLNDLWKYSGGQWTWMSGSNLGSDPGISVQMPVYGTQGVASSNNVPGARNIANSWSDASGNLWLFGGEGVDSNGKLGLLNDLWKYSGGQWTWMSGSNLGNQYGTYGTLGTAAPGNVPGARTNPVTWTDASGNLWLFGGWGYDSGGNPTQLNSELNDLWKYSAGEWTWMGGSNVAGQSGNYGTKGLAAPGNIPGGRDSAVGWSDSTGNFWLFGGTGCDSTGVCTIDLNDLWKYSGGQWTWMSGSNLAGQGGTYGTQGTPAPGNVPGCRDWAVGWADKSGNLWLFGGAPVDCGTSSTAKFNDLWEYQP